MPGADPGGGACSTTPPAPSPSARTAVSSARSTSSSRTAPVPASSAAARPGPSATPSAGNRGRPRRRRPRRHNALLRSALFSGCREELTTRNVAKLVEPSRTGKCELKPWSPDETLDFLGALSKDRLYAAFVLAIAMGLPPRRAHRAALVGRRPRASSTSASRRSCAGRRGRRRFHEPPPSGCPAARALHRVRCAGIGRGRRRPGSEQRRPGGSRTTSSPTEPSARSSHGVSAGPGSLTRFARSAGLRVIQMHNARHHGDAPHSGRGRARRGDGDPGHCNILPGCLSASQVRCHPTLQQSPSCRTRSPRP